MGEQAGKIGKKLEGFGENLFSRLGWEELKRDCEIKCTRPGHKKRTHGIDLLLKFKNPYTKGTQAIIVECKNRQMKSIGQDEIDSWVKELINNIECAQSASELSDANISDATFNTGLLLIHANDAFDESKFNEYLRGIKIPSRRNPINVFVAGNKDINKWTSLLNKIESSLKTGFEFLYPSINGSSKEYGCFIPINFLYSKFVFARRIYDVPGTYQGMQCTNHKSQSIVFSFDDISIDAFKYLWSMFKYYQLEGSDEYLFVFYPKDKDDAEYVKENFIKTLKAIDNPIDLSTQTKIIIDFIDNRDLSPVDIGR